MALDSSAFGENLKDLAIEAVSLRHLGIWLRVMPESGRILRRASNQRLIRPPLRKYNTGAVQGSDGPYGNEARPLDTPLARTPLVRQQQCLLWVLT